MPTMPADQLRRMLEQTLIPPTQVVELDPDTIAATTIRLKDTRGSLAESYQLNSSLTPTSYARLGDRDDIETVIDFYLTTAADGYDQLIAGKSRWALPLTDAPSWVHRLLLPMSSHPAMAATLFNADLMVAFDGGLWRLIPNRAGLQFEGTWDSDLAGQVRRAVPSLPPGAPPTGAIFIVGHLTRAAYLSGDRSFRAAAIGAGTLLGLIYSLLAGQPPFIRFQATHQFIDHQVNQAARCDGVERGVQVLCLIDELGDGAPSCPLPAQESR